MDYTVTHSQNDCHIALIAPRFWYKLRGKRYAKWKANEYIAGLFREYIEAYNSKVNMDIEEFISDFDREMKTAGEKLIRFAADKDAFKAALNRTEYLSENKPAANAGYLLSKENMALLKMNSSVRYALSVLENRLEYAENYHLNKLNAFIEGVSIYEPELSEELSIILNTVFCRAERMYEIIYTQVKNDVTRMELRRQIDDYKHIYDTDAEESSQRQPETISSEDAQSC